jgi:hypothetical protein
MAKVQYSAVVGDARNKVGGVVFTRTRGGPTVRRKVSPTQPRSTYQRNVRANFTGLTKAWAALGETVRAAWTAFARNNPTKDVFGATVTLTGHQMYVRLNRSLATIGVAALTNPPANLSVNYPGTIGVTHDGPPVTTIQMDWSDPGSVGGSESCVVFASPPLSAGRSTAGARMAKILHSAPGLVGPYFLYADYVTKYGAPATGSKIFFRAFLVRTTNGAAGIASEFALTI